MTLEINEYIKFEKFNSKDSSLYLLERDAPTPDEKEIVENIPFVQGDLDFSMILGERVFENREITYKFLAFDTEYCDRKRLERTIKQQLMAYGRSKLFDTHDLAYFWLGKCKTVEVEDDEEFHRLTVTIIFDCYPFLFARKAYFDDIWDSFLVTDDLASWTKFDITENGNTVLVYNSGIVSVAPEIVASTDFKVTTEDGTTYSFLSGTTTDYILQLSPGVNRLKIEPARAGRTGTIAFHFESEVMG